MKKRNTFLLVFVLLSGQMFGGAFIKKFAGGGESEEKKIFITEADEKKTQLEKIQQELKKQEEEFAEFEKEAKKTLPETAGKINETKARIKSEPQNEEFLTSIISPLNDLYQIIKDRQQQYTRQKDLLAEHSKLLDEFLKDPKLAEYLKEYQDSKRVLFFFKDLRALNKMEIDLQKQIKSLEQQEKNLIAELEGREKSAAVAQKAFQEKQEELKAFSAAPDKKSSEETFGFNIQQKTELLLLQEQLLNEKVAFAKLKVLSTKQKIAQIQTKLSIERSRLKILIKVSEKIEPLVQVSEEDIVNARAELDKQKNKIFRVTETYRQQSEALAREAKVLLQELEKVARNYNVQADEKLDDWSFEPDQTAVSYAGLISSANVKARQKLAQREQELLEAQRQLENKKLAYEKLKVNVKESFYGIKKNRFPSAEAITQEVKKYEAPKADIESTLSQFKERKNVATLLLSSQRKARENIEKIAKDLQQKQATLFRGRQGSSEYARLAMLLRGALDKIQKQIEVTEKTLAIYRDIIAVSKNAQQEVGFILDRLTAASFLQRGESAIRWEDAKDIVPNVKQFWTDFSTSLSRFSFSVLSENFKDTFPSMYDLLLLLLKMALLVAFLLLFRFYLRSKLHAFFVGLGQYAGFTRISLLMRVFIEFFVSNFLVISIWIILWVMIRLGAIPGQLVHILFYLVSIPYVIYLITRFFTKFVSFNAEHEYGILGKQFQKRFVLVVSVLLYATVVIQFFRRAYMLYGYPQSQLPVILFHINFIILQICLIFLITKEQIQSLIPETTDFWKSVRVQVDRFYYLILACIVAIIVMSHPGVGFGKLVLYALSRLALTAIFVPVLFWAQSLLKKISSKLFFVTEGDVAKERFGSAKTWYGLAVIISFLLLLIVGLVVVAKIWGYPITFKTVFDFMKAERFRVEKPISFLTFFQILAFVIAGFLLAAIFKRFVLRKIFDLLLIEMGVQQAVFGVTRYAIILSVTVIGLQNVGLGPLTKWLFGALLAVGFVIKEPLGDLVAYFILLIQRPLKIGDYIQIDDKSFGVVRKISPRSTVLRQKNSMSVVVPNSQILSKAVSNWNYVSGFVAVDDIFVNVLYKENPDRVIEVLREAVESHPNILKSPKPIVRLENLGEYSFTFLVRGYVSSHYTLDKWNIAGDLRLAIVRALRENKISLAVPVRIMVPSKIKKGTSKQVVTVQEEPGAEEIEPDDNGQ